MVSEATRSVSIGTGAYVINKESLCLVCFVLFVSFVVHAVFVPLWSRSPSLDEPVLQRLRYMLPLYAFRPCEIGNGPRDFQQPVVAACAEGEPLGGCEQQRSSFLVGTAMRRDGATSEIRVHARPIRTKARPLKKARRENTLTH